MTYVEPPLADDPSTGSDFRMLADQLIMRPGLGAHSDEYTELVFVRCHLALRHVLDRGIHAARAALAEDLDGLPEPANEHASSELLSRANAFSFADAGSDRLTRLIHLMDPFDLSLDEQDHEIAQRYLQRLEAGEVGLREPEGTPQSWRSAFTLAAALLLQCDAYYEEMDKYDETMAGCRWWS